MRIVLLLLKLLMELLKTLPQSSVFPCTEVLQTKEDFSELVFAPLVF